MGQFHKNSGEIQNYDIQIVSEKDGIDVIYITIETDLGISKYRIASDTHHPDIKKIADRFSVRLKIAKESNADFQINEYEERMYLFVDFPDKKNLQFTGSKI